LREEPIKSERLYDGQVVKLDVDTLRLADGRIARREVIRHPGAVLVIPWLDEERILLIQQFRYAPGQFLLELPAGTLDHPDESPAQCAQRELIEETGYQAACLEKIATFYTTPGFTDEIMHCFRATGLTLAAGKRDAEECINVVPLPYTAALAMIERGEIRDGKTLVGLLLEKK
jgi:ADP-ribose pyrophosphatase